MFPITISFTVSTPAELARLVAATGAQTSVDAPPGVKAAKKSENPAVIPNDAAGQATQAVKPEPASASPSEGNGKPAAASAAQPAATPVTPEPTAAASGGEARQIDYDKDVKPALLKLVQTKGRAAGRKIIDAFAPTKEKLSEAITTQEQYQQALDLIAKEMA